MKVEIECLDDEFNCAVALRNRIRRGLKAAGFLHAQTKEGSYYTKRRELADSLDEFIKGLEKHS
jgi:hypothetical protein